MSIYFVRCADDTSRVKIGKAHDVKRRLYELSRFPSAAWRDAAEHAGAGGRLNLLVEVEGYSETERALHAMLAAHRLHGEWFDATAPIVEAVLGYAQEYGSVNGLVPDAIAYDRAQACPHASMRAAHVHGLCVLCDDEIPIVSTPEPLDTRSTEVVGSAPAEVGGDAHRIMASIGAQVHADDARAAEDAAALYDEMLAILAAADAEAARRNLGEFFRQAVRAGAVHGLHKLQWSPHLDATCDHVQWLLEAWLVCNGKGTDEMVQRQISFWRLHYTDDVLLEMHTRDPKTGELVGPWMHEPIVQNMIENICPGTLKSTIAMVIANAWIWLWAPEFQFGAASWLDKNVERDSDATRDLVTSEWYRTTFAIDWTIRPDKDSKGLWATTAGGVRLSRTMQAGFTGQHVHGMFIDDPDDADKVWQDAMRRLVQGKFSRAMENRIHDEITCIRFVLQQRVHVDDLTGYLLNIKRWTPKDRKGWAWLVIPLQYGRAPVEAPKSTPFGWSDWRTVNGECMHPERFPIHVIADKLKTLGEVGFGAQYNNNPTPLTGGMFARDKARWWRYEDENPALMRKRPDGAVSRDVEPALVIKRGKHNLPALDRITISVDASFGAKTKTASRVGLTVYGYQGEACFALEDRSRVMGVQEQYDAIAQCAADWAPAADKMLVELKALGEAVVNEMDKVLRAGKYKGRDGRPLAITVVGITVGNEDGKIVRARGIVPVWDARLVYVHDGADWVYPTYDDSGKTIDDGWFNEVTGFPFMKKNDRADTLSQVVNYYRENGDAEARARALNVW